MSDKNRTAAGLLFTLRGAMSEEDARGFADAHREMAAQIFAACLPAVSALASTRTHWEHLAQALTDLPRVSFVTEGWSLAVYEAAEAFARRARPSAARQLEEAAGIFAETAAAMPEDERDELRQAIEDTPLCPVDVAAPGVM